MNKTDNKLSIIETKQIIDFTENYFSAICHSGIRWSSLGIYYRNSIPDRKLLNAKKKYAKFNSDDESALLLVDDSLLGSARKGFVMTESNIYYSLGNQDNEALSSGSVRGALSLNNVKTIIFREKMLTTTLVVNGAPFANLTYISRDEINILNDFFNKLFSNDFGSATELETPHEELNNKQSDWYYEKDGKQIGPVSEDEIKSCIETSYLSYGNMICQKGSRSWMKLENSALKHLITGRVPPPQNVRANIAISSKGFGGKRCFVMILFVLIVAGTSFNFYKSSKYADKYYHSTADRFNAGVGYFITLGIAPKTGANLVSKLNLCGPTESKEMLELKRKGYKDLGAAAEYFKRHRNQ